MFYVLGSGSYSATIRRIYCCVSMATLSVFIAVLTYVRKNYKGKRVGALVATNVKRTRHSFTFYVLCLLCSRKIVWYKQQPLLITSLAEN